MGAAPAPRFSNELLTKQLEAWLAEKERPTGVFCSTDYEAGFCCNFLYEHGLKPQRDLDIIGCNNDIFGSMMMPQALPASIELCSAEIGRQAAVLLLDRINGLEAPRVVRKFRAAAGAARRVRAAHLEETDQCTGKTGRMECVSI